MIFYLQEVSESHQESYHDSNLERITNKKYGRQVKKI